MLQRVTYKLMSRDQTYWYFEILTFGSIFFFSSCMCADKKESPNKAYSMKKMTLDESKTSSEEHY